jgi:hypothetical protein
MLTKNDFPQYDGLYYVGNVIDIDGDGWVDEEQVELIIEEINAGVDKVQIFAYPNRPELIYLPVTPDDKLNFIHLN